MNSANDPPNSSPPANPLLATAQEQHWMWQVFAHSPQAMILEGLDGNIREVNRAACEMFRYAREELVGKSVRLLWSKNTIRDFAPLREACLRGETLPGVELKLVTKSRKRRTVMVTAHPLTSPSGSVTGLATIARDITHQKRAEQRLLHGLQRRDEFLATLSHELRNPLGAVLNAARVIRHSLHTPENLEAAVNIIEQQLSQTSRLLDDLLDISRIANNKMVLKQEVVDLREIAQRALNTVQVQFEQREQQVDLELHSHPVKVNGDSARLLQVVENLLCNAAKYTPPQGHVRLVVSREADQALLRVSDNGRGLSREMLNTIFEPFAQGDHGEEINSGGMGVGLSLVRSLVELHGGSIKVRSDGMNLGSEFTVKFPSSAREIIAKKPVSRQAVAANRRLVLVEDNVHSRQSLKMLLNLEGFQATDAPHAAAGFELITTTQPAIAILDIGLPDMSGYQLAKKLRDAMQERTPYLIALTGYGRESDRRAVFEAGFDAHLVKPLDIDLLYETLKQVPAGDLPAYE